MQKFIFFIAFLLLLPTACSDDDLFSPLPATEENAGHEDFEWSRTPERSTRYSFLRNFGVGYSYNAVKGSYCDWNDLRCQIVNRAELDRVEANTGMKLWTVSKMEILQSHSQFRYNLRDYVAAVRLDTDIEVDLGLYGYEKRKRQYILEDGLREQFYYMIEECMQLGHQSLAVADILTLVEKGDEALLTRSFRDAVAHLAEMNCHAFSVDSFLNVYGTHVITSASVGGELRIDLRNDMFRYSDQVQEKEWTTEQILWAYEHREEARQRNDYHWIENSSLNISARGGEQSHLTGLLGPADFEGKREFSIQPLEAWRESLYFDPDDEANSNVEMTSMSVTPIWRFVAALDEEVAQYVKAAVQQDVSYQQKLLGNRNFFNTSFPVRYAEAACRYRSADGWQTLSEPIGEEDRQGRCVNILSGGRFVATVCHECIDGEWYWVAYPIYDGRVKQTNGLAVRDGQAWKLFRNGETCRLTPLYPSQVTQTDRFYITDGAIGLDPYEGMDYAPSQPMLYAELDHGVRPDGTVAGRPFAVRKSGADFSLDPQTPADCAIAGWTYDPATATWLRSDTYTYIYNPTEMDAP